MLLHHGDSKKYYFLCYITILQGKMCQRRIGNLLGKNPQNLPRKGGTLCAKINRYHFQPSGIRILPQKYFIKDFDLGSRPIAAFVRSDPNRSESQKVGF